MHRPAFARHDFSSQRRLLAAGDIHGRFDLLEARLAELKFDANCDRLILLGDLVDRGEFNEQALDWCQRPGINRVLGNHEFLLHAAVIGGSYGEKIHRENGGEWFAGIRDPEERELWSQTLMDCPIAIEALTPGGRRVGFIHADVPTSTWDELEPALASSADPIEMEGTIWDCMWQRDRINHLKMAHRFNAAEDDIDFSVPGIDHIFFGHTPVKAPVNHRNCTWIDTGAFSTNILTVLDVDSWIDHLSR